MVSAVLLPNPKMYFEIAGVPAVGGKVYTYDAGTLNPRTTYTDSAGGASNTNPIILDARGEAVVYWSGAYKVILKDPTDVPVWTVDNFTDQGSSTVNLGTTNSVAIALNTWISAMPWNGREFGVLANGSDMSQLIANAITDLKTAGGGELILPRGTITLNGLAGSDSKKNGILLPYTTASSLANRILIRGQGRNTVLQAGATGMYIVRLSDSYCGLQDLSIDGNGLGTVSGLGIVPESTTQITTVVNQLFNNIRNVEIRGCVEGLEMKCGPDPSGIDSGCWYNNFYDLNIYNCTRGLWMRDGPNADSSGVNRNNFFGGRVGQASCNTGIQIDAGVTNEFHSMHFEGIATGASPNATPTGVKIALNGPNSGNNDSNRFFGCQFEGNTRDIENANSTTEFYGCGYAGTKVLFTANPLYSFGGGGSSVTPQVYGPLAFQNVAALPGVDLNALVASVPHEFLQGFYGPRQAVGVSAAVGLNIQFGSYTNVTAAGGGTSSQGFIFSAFDKAALYLAMHCGTSNSNSTHNATKLSLFAEFTAGTFTEVGTIVDVKNTITTSTITLARSSVTITMTSNITGAIGGETVNVNLHLWRVA